MARIAANDPVENSTIEHGDRQVAEEFLPIIHPVFANRRPDGSASTTASAHSTCKPTSTNSSFGSTADLFNALRSLLGIAVDASAPTYDVLYSGKCAIQNVVVMDENRIGKG
jgi:hypothetical protein